MTPYHPLTDTGTPPEDAAMIWPWPHNWSAQVVRRPEWVTGVTKSATGAEQRQALREFPREQVTYEHLLEGSDSAMAFALLREWKGRDWLVPDWTEATKTTAPAGAVLSLARSSVPAGMALLGTEVVTLLDANGTLDVSPSGSWPAGTVAVPLRLATLDSDQTVSHVTGTVSRISPTFLFSEPVQVDETVLTRIAEPGRVSTSGTFTLVSGAYGQGVRSAGLSVSMGGTFGGSNVGTLEFWINADASPSWQAAVLSFSTNAYVSLAAGPVVSFYGIFANKYFPLPTTGVWHHCAVSCDGAVARAFLNGVQVGSAITADQPAVTFNSVNLFGYLSNHDSLQGALDDVRFTQACRYTSDFTPSPCVVGEGDPYWYDVAFLVNGEVSRWGRGPTGPLAVGADPRGHMLPWSHNYTSPGSTQISREMDEMDPGVGMRHTRPRHDQSTSQWSYETLLESDIDILAFRALLQQHKGSAIRLYSAPPGSEIEVTQVVAGVATVPTGRFWESSSRPFNILALLLDTGWVYYGVDRAFPGSVRLFAGTANHAPGTILGARGVHYARLLGDAVEIKYVTPGVAEVSLPLVSVAQ
jgi:hypothetical protein